ncbi:SDR family oxidoreductase [Pseudonocardia sp. TRM90224]|uniref:SDR family oxidoreductase n=1 Tax=Pseudonocardia sp. TRM90224 TaxID=2812678 RepID=UPI001E5AEF9E|nr:NmrA family NAD(P)-binding protein [Pseudonocardia sp. TRM90224]
MSEARRHLVIGANGAQGAAVVRRLLADGEHVRGFGRRAGAHLVPGDLADPSTLTAAFAGITHVSAVLPLVFDRETVLTHVRNIVDAAKAAAVTRLVLNTNTPVPRDVTPFAAYETRRAAEDAVRCSGLPVVVLRPTVYLDNLANPVTGRAVVEDGVLAYPLPPDRSVAWISHDDLAAATVAALHRPGIEGAVVRLGGPEAFSGAELAATFGAATGRQVTYLPLEVERFESGLRDVLGEAAAAGVAGIYRWAAQAADPDLFAPDHDEVERVLRVRMHPIATWVAAQRWERWAATAVR